jgi:hypothetical protein
VWITTAVSRLPRFSLQCQKPSTATLLHRIVICGGFEGITVAEFIGWSIGMVIVGFLAGTLKRDCDMMKLCRSQMQRGDYWFDRYMMEVREDWEPMTQDF